jgi:hypothetical protein
MRLLAKSFLLAWLVVAIAYLPVAQAQTAVPDTDQSTRLTDYLHSHHLPLVGAQVMESRTGAQTVLLFGYTASDFGKSDAETKTRRFLKDTDVAINNHIRVRPELASMRSTAPSAGAIDAQPPSGEGQQPPSGEAQPPPSSEAPPPDQLGDAQNYQNQQPNGAQQQYINQQTQQYMNQGNSGGGMNAMGGGMLSSGGGIASTLIPLIGMGLAIGLGGGGSGIGMGVSPGFGSSFGSSNPSNGYGGGYGAPAPYGGGGVPYGGSPYGNSGGTYP